MNNAQNYIYSRTAASAICQTKIEKIEVWANHTVWVKFSKGSKLISQKQFKEYFAESRKTRSQNTKIIGQTKNGFIAKSENSEKTYQILPQKTRIYCECKDWETQFTLGIKTPMCKHTYAVLHQLNINSLAEYLAIQNHYHF